MIIFNKDDSVLKNIASVIEKRMKKPRDFSLILDSTMSEFEGTYTDGVIKAGSYAQILDIAGRAIRKNIENGKIVSHKQVSGIYLATHNNNYFQEAPLEELFEYIDDLAFWGMNHLQLWFDMYFFANIEEGKETIEKFKKILNHAKSIGVNIGMVAQVNEAFRTSPKELRADWTCGHDGYIYNLNDHYHVEICPSVDGGMEKILEYRRAFLEAFKDVDFDFFVLGAYDEGGCTCSKCAPWGANGFIRCCEEIIALIKEYYSDATIIISLWQFGTFTGNDIEFEGMKKALEDGKFKECKYLCSEPQYAKYPFEKGMPRPLLGFPEISMCNTLPWGGYGANPIPKLLQSLWDENGDKLEGGLPYCEGFYEDLNKVIMLRLYRENQNVEATVREYLSYEFDLEGEMLTKTLKAVMDMEETLYRSLKPGHRYLMENPENVFSIEESIKEVDAQLKEEIRQSKRWQMIYLRAVIDGELARNDFKRNDKVKEYFNKLIELSHLQNAGVHIKPDIFESKNTGRALTEDEDRILSVILGDAQ